MKTVLFIDETANDLWQTFQTYDFLIDEFRSADAFSLCPWSSTGTSVSEAIPDLAEAVGSVSLWQAVVVCDLRLPDAALRDDVHFDNPFDFVESYNVEPGDPFRESEHALVRLTQMLGGLPERPFLKWGQGEEATEPERLGEWEVAYAEGGEDFDLLERYRIGLPSPERIVCVTPRDVDEAFRDAKLRTARRAQSASASGHEGTSVPSRLDFCQRNAYPSQARFVVVDRRAPAKESEEENGGKEPMDAASSADASECTVRQPFWFGFWMCVLTLVTSAADSPSLGAYEVYRISADVDARVLADMLATRRAQWVGACRAIDARCEEDALRLAVSEYETPATPRAETSIPVSIDAISSEQLLADSSGLGLFKDTPDKDKPVWRAQRKRIESQFHELLRGPVRAMRSAAARFRAQRPPSCEELEYCILNEHQRDKLEDELHAQEYELAVAVGKPPFAFESHESLFDEHGAAIERSIDARAGKLSAVLTLVAALFALVIGFLPYCLGGMGGIGASGAAVAVTFCCCGVLTLVWFYTLMHMRRDVRDAYAALNRAVDAVAASLEAAAARLERRLSSAATFRKRWSLLERQRSLGAPTSEMNRLGYAAALLKTRIRDIDAIAQGCELAPIDTKDVPDYDWRTCASLLRESSFFNLRDVVPFTVGGDLLFAVADEAASMPPYPFISRVSLDPLKLME